MTFKSILAGLQSRGGGLRFALLIGLCLRAGGAVASFIMTYLIARTQGAEVVGLYQIGLTTASLAALVASRGLPLVLVRSAAGLLADKRLGDLATTFHTSQRYIFLSGLALIATVIALAWPLGSIVLGQSEAVIFILACAPLVLILPQLRLNTEMLRSLGSVWLSQSLEGIFYTSLTAVVIAAIWFSSFELAAISIPLIYLANAGLAVFLSRAALRRRMHGWGSGEAQLAPFTGVTAVSAAVVMVLGEWAILIIIGSALGLIDAGVYRTVFMICAVFQMVTASFATMAGPHLARARAAGDPQGVYSILRTAGLLGLVVCAPGAILVFAAPEWLLGWFGEEFRRGATALVLLAIAQLIGVANGPTAPATLMLGREKISLQIEVALIAFTVPATLLLVGVYGLTGAAGALLAASIVRCVASRMTLAFIWPKSRITGSAT